MESVVDIGLFILISYEPQQNVSGHPLVKVQFPLKPKLQRSLGVGLMVLSFQFYAM